MTVISSLWKTLRRHVGHTLRCARESNTAAGFTFETVSIRCEDCGEVLVEAADVERASPQKE